MMLSFILPVLIAPRDIGDMRGQNTSEKGQMAYILGQPLAYARVLASNMIRTLPSYVMGENSLGLLGHQGQVSFPWLIYAGSARTVILWKTSGMEAEIVDPGSVYRNGSSGMDIHVYCVYDTRKYLHRWSAGAVLHSVSVPALVGV